MHPFVVFFVIIIMYLCVYRILATRAARKYWLIFGGHISFEEFYHKYARWGVWHRASNDRMMSRLFGVQSNFIERLSYPEMISEEQKQAIDKLHRVLLGLSNVLGAIAVGAWVSFAIWGAAGS